MTPPVPASTPPAASHLESAAFDDIDRHFARFVERLSGGANPELALAAALVSRSRGEGDICLDLRTVSATGFPPEKPQEAIRLPEFEDWVAQLRAAPVVGEPEEFKPLVLDARGRLYLHRYWEYESSLARAIRHRAALTVEGIDDDLLREGLARFFPAHEGATETDWQKVAAETAVRRNFCVISGGPGTGKTRTVAVVLALLLEQAGGRPLRIALAAPTGKAAARLQESLKTLKATLPCDAAIRARLPEETFTLHRLLGGVPGVARFRYHADNPLPFEVVVVDEASMVDLALMAKLFEAIPTAARVVLLGDKDQLASVEAGAVLGDICAGVGQASSPPLAGCIVELKKNFRFGADNGILALSNAINAGNAERALGLLRAPLSLVHPCHDSGGVRPSPGAETSECQRAQECPQDLVASRVAAPEDGRTPVQGFNARMGSEDSHPGPQNRENVRPSFVEADSLEKEFASEALHSGTAQQLEMFDLLDGNAASPLSPEKRAVLGADPSSNHGILNQIQGIASAPLPVPGRLKEELRERVLEGFGDVLRAREPLASLQALGRFRILCALRQGPYGVEALNRLAEETLSEAQLIPARERWYWGRPVMVTRNDYQLKLFNGDVGVILPDPATGEARAWFPGADNTLRSVPPLRLPEHETVFAMTVHKSQGSEFEEVLLVLPDRDSPVLTRELLYTGATRASRRVEMWFNEPVLRAALARRVERTSGLRDALWGQSMVSHESCDTID